MANTTRIISTPAPLPFQPPPLREDSVGKLTRNFFLSFSFLIGLLLVFFSWRAGVRQDLENWGIWDAEFSERALPMAIRVEEVPLSAQQAERYKGSHFLRLAIVEDNFKKSFRPDQRLTIRHQVKRLNEAIKNRPYDERLLTSDMLLRIAIDDSDEERPSYQVVLRDLTAINRSPKHKIDTDRSPSPIGSIYLRPRAKPVLYLTNGKLGLMLLPVPNQTPGNDGGESSLNQPSPAGLTSGMRVPIAGSGFYAAAQFNLEQSGLIASLWAQSSQGGHMLMLRTDKRVLIDGIEQIRTTASRYEYSEPFSIEVGQTLELDGYPFELRQEESAIVAESTSASSARRSYPRGREFPIIGPYIASGEHQSVGLDYLFHEYLAGSKDRQPGKIWLTLDETLQQAWQQDIQELAKQSQNKIANGLIMNASSGALLAMADHVEIDGETLLFPDPNHSDEVMRALKPRARNLDSTTRRKKKVSSQDDCTPTDLPLDTRDINERFRLRHRSFQRHVIGSVAKPFLALTALEQIDQAEHFQLKIRYPLLPNRCFSQPIPRKNRLFDHQEMDFYNFLVRSDNGYQHALGYLALAGYRSLDQVPERWRSGGPYEFDPLKPLAKMVDDVIPKNGRFNLPPEHPFSDQTQRLFQIQTGPLQHAGIRDYDETLFGPLWLLQENILRESGKDPESLYARATACAPELPRMELFRIHDLNDTSNYLFGGNYNRWTDVKLCESFSRIVTGKKVQARLISRYLDTDTGKVIDLEEESKTWQEVDDDHLRLMREALEGVVRSPLGTARRLSSASERTSFPRFGRQSGDNFRIFAKTGTIDELPRRNESKILVISFGYWNSARQTFYQPSFTASFYLQAAIDEYAILTLVQNQLPKWWNLLARLDWPSYQENP